MQYIIENAYTKKLYAKLKLNMIDLQLLVISDIATLEPGHRCIVDEDDYDAFVALQYKAGEVIVLTEKQGHILPLHDTVRFVIKYQSTKNILTLISRTAFPITFLVFATKSADKEAIIEAVSKKHEIDRVISLDFSPNSSFSLFDNLTCIEEKNFNSATIDVITNIQDYLNPPISDLITLVNRLRGSNRLLIVSSPLKGALDASLLDLSDTIILVENDNAMKWETHLNHMLKSKHFEVMAYDALS